MRRLAIIGMLAAASAVLPLSAHHSLHANYDMDQRATIQGTVTKFLLRNPHSWVQVQVADENGVLQDWDIEWGGGGALRARGIGRDTLKEGNVVTVVMSPERQPQPRQHRGLLRVIHRDSDGFEWGTKPGEEPQEWGPAVQKQ